MTNKATKAQNSFMALLVFCSRCDLCVNLTPTARYLVSVDVCILGPKMVEFGKFPPSYQRNHSYFLNTTNTHVQNGSKNKN